MMVRRLVRKGWRKPISVKRINNQCKLSLRGLSRVFLSFVCSPVGSMRSGTELLPLSHAKCQFISFCYSAFAFCANGQNDDNVEILVGTKTSVKVIWDGLTWPKPPQHLLSSHRMKLIFIFSIRFAIYVPYIFLFSLSLSFFFRRQMGRGMFLATF